MSIYISFGQDKLFFCDTMIELQYDFFKDPFESRLGEIEKAIYDTRISQDKQRRAQFAAIGELRKLVLELSSRLSIIESHICKPHEKVSDE